MEPHIVTAESLIHPALGSGAETGSLAGERIIRREFLPPFSNPPISNYRKLWATSPTAFWSSFRVLPGEGGAVNQLGTKPVTSAQTGFQEVGFGYTFKAAFTTDYWFEIEIDAGPTTSNGSKNTLELELRGARVPKVVVPVTSRYLKTRAYLDAQLTGGTQYTLLFKSRVEITVSPGQTRYGEVIARFPRLVVSHLRPWGIEPAGTESVYSDAIDLEQALESLRAEGGEVSLQPVSFQDIARAGVEGFKGFSGGE